MLRRASALRPATRLSRRSRSPTASRLAISSRDVWCATSQRLVCSQAFKVMTSTCYKEDRSLLHRRHEVVPRAHLPDELVRRIHDRVDLPSQLPVGIRQSVHDLAQRNVSDDQQIDIAALLQLTSRRRSENEG